MAIQMRRGKNADFDSTKMLPGEWAVSVDAVSSKQIVWMCFAPGVVKRMGTLEDFDADIQELIRAQLDSINASVESCASSEQSARESAFGASTSASNANTSAIDAADSESNASGSATLAQSYAKGGTGTRAGEDTDSAKYYMEQSKKAAVVTDRVDALEAPEYEVAGDLANLQSGESIFTAFGKLAKSVSEFITHKTLQATATILGHVKLSNSSSITTVGAYALDATEKNATIPGTLAYEQEVLTTNLKNMEKVVTGVLPSAGNHIVIPYPSGYDKSNCMITSSMFFYNAYTWLECRDSNITVRLDTGGVTIVMPSTISGTASYIVGQNVKVLLRKLTNEMYV